MADHVVVSILAEEQPFAEDKNYQDERNDEHGVLDEEITLVPAPIPVRHMSIDENSPLMGSHHHHRYPEPEKSSWMKIWKVYQSWLVSRPMLTKSITAAILVGCGDLAGQCIDLATNQAVTSLDLWRISSYTLMGLLLQAPVTHYYYLLLDSKLPPTPSPWTATTFLKLAIDQLIFAPSFTVLVFFFLGFCEGDSVGQICQHLQETFLTTMIANWKLWVPAVFVNLAFCPPELRVLYCNVIFFVWSIILSLLLK